jgi:glutamate N-acetyltransferase/amino-acid N-acetyltransferase
MSGLQNVSGYHCAGIKAGIKKSGKHDIGIVIADTPVNAAGVFTLNKVRAAPVKLSEKHILNTSQFKAIIVNSGNANACTGDDGEANALEMCQLAASALDCKPEEILVCSTGIIGVQLPMEKIRSGIKQVVKTALGKNDPDSFVKAILTTDLVEKNADTEFLVGGKKYHIGGTCKGSGMIHPNMATMLGFIITDFPLSKNDLRKALLWCTERSFNCLSVDGDTSTNDTVLLFAPVPVDNSNKYFEEFKNSLLVVCRSLAKQVAKDGEGAEHLVTIQVKNASSFDSARNIAKSIAKSPLVKTAIAGCDPNWGRILCAIGYSGEEIDETKVKISIEDIMVYNAKPVAFDAKVLSAKMKTKEITLYIDIGAGSEAIEYYTCDFTHGYISINADYST